jgi:hypothetical protein
LNRLQFGRKLTSLAQRNQQHERGGKLDFRMEGFLLNKGRLRGIAEATLKHIHANAATFMSLIGDLAPKEHPTLWSGNDRNSANEQTT